MNDERKKLNLFDLTSIGIGTVICAGVFSMIGFGIAYTGRSITIALFLAMFLVVMQSIRDPILSSIFEVDGGTYGLTALTSPDPLFAGFTAANDVAFKLGSNVIGLLAIVQYISILYPAINNCRTAAAIIILTTLYVIAIVGDKLAAKVQNIMAVMMYIALGLFVIYGIINYNPAAYQGEPAMVNGFTGLMMATALMSYTCNGFQMVINIGRGAKNPRRDIPLAYFISAFISASIYALIGFAATHSYSYGETAGANLGDLAKLMMPSGAYTFFVVGGALFALSTSLLGSITAGYRPLMTSARDGWLPAFFGKTFSKRNIPCVFIFLYLINLIPLLLGITLNDLATMSLVPLGIIVIIASYVCSAILVCYCFITNTIKIPTLIITLGIFAYGAWRNKYGRIDIQSKHEYEAQD